MSGAWMTVFPSLYADDGRRFWASWLSLFRRFEQPYRSVAADRNPWIAFGIFTNDHRSVPNHERTYALALDLDAPVERVADVFQNFYAFVYTTRRSTERAPRSRMVVPLSRPVLTEEQPRVWRWLASFAERAGLEPDYAAKDCARVWTIPITPDVAPYSYCLLEGAFADVEDALASIPEEQPLPPRALVDDSIARRGRLSALRSAARAERAS